MAPGETHSSGGAGVAGAKRPPALPRPLRGGVEAAPTATLEARAGQGHAVRPAAHQDPCPRHCRVHPQCPPAAADAHGDHCRAPRPPLPEASRAWQPQRCRTDGSTASDRAARKSRPSSAIHDCRGVAGGWRPRAVIAFPSAATRVPGRRRAAPPERGASVSQRLRQVADGDRAALPGEVQQHLGDGAPFAGHAVRVDLRLVRRHHRAGRCRPRSRRRPAARAAPCVAQRIGNVEHRARAQVVEHGRR